MFKCRNFWIFETFAKYKDDFFINIILSQNLLHIIIRVGHVCNETTTRLNYCFWNIILSETVEHFTHLLLLFSNFKTNLRLWIYQWRQGIEAVWCDSVVALPSVDIGHNGKMNFLSDIVSFDVWMTSGCSDKKHVKNSVRIIFDIMDV